MHLIHLGTIVGSATLLLASTVPFRPPHHQIGQLQVLSFLPRKYLGCIGQDFRWYNVPQSECGLFRATFTDGPPKKIYHLNVTIENRAGVLCGNINGPQTCSLDDKYGVLCSERNGLQTCSPNVTSEYALFEADPREDRTEIYGSFFYDEEPTPGRPTALYTTLQAPGHPNIYPYWVAVANSSCFDCTASQTSTGSASSPSPTDGSAPGGGHSTALVIACALLFGLAVIF